MFRSAARPLRAQIVTAFVRFWRNFLCSVRSLRSRRNCICTCSFGGEAAFLALPRFIASPPHSLRGFFSSTKPKLCARERSRRQRRLLSLWHEMFASFELGMKNQSGKMWISYPLGRGKLKATDNFERLDSKLMTILSKHRPCASELSSLNVCKCLRI